MADTLDVNPNFFFSEDRPEENDSSNHEQYNVETIHIIMEEKRINIPF
jgi:hypothetical protein